MAVHGSGERTRSTQRGFAVPGVRIGSPPFNDALRGPRFEVPGALIRLLEGSAIGVLRGTVFGGPDWANDAFLAMSGYTRAEFDAGLVDWVEMTPRRWRSIDRRRLATARRHGTSPTFEKEFIRKDGSRWPALVGYAADPFDTDAIAAFVVDLTGARVEESARLGVEARYARFFEVSNVAFWTADAQGRATLSAAATADRLGVDTQLDTAEAQAELIHPEDRAFAIATWQRAIADGKAYDIQLRARGLDGGPYRWTRLQAFPDVEHGRVVGWYGTSEDIHERHLTSIALAESEARFRRLADDIPVMVWLTDVDGGSNYLSRAWFEFTGQSFAEARGLGWMAVVHPDDRERLRPIGDAMAEQRSFELDFRVLGAAGDCRWVHSSGRPRKSDDGTLLGYAGCLTDIHARKLAEGELAATQQRLSRALDGTGVVVWEWDVVADETKISSSALSISGVQQSGAEYQRIEYQAFVHPADLPRIASNLKAYVDGSSDSFEVEIRIRTCDDGWVWVLDRGTASARDGTGRVLHMVGTLTIIEASKRAEARLLWTVEHDALTGLANRTLFHARLDEALAQRAAGERVALALLDIDEFKTVNDLHGHGAGDALLVALAVRLRDFAGEGETVARLGGDEFTIVLPRCGSDVETRARLVALRTALAEPFEHDGKLLACNASIGVCIATDEDGSSLLKHADLAMYAAKTAGYGGVALFDSSLAVQANRAVAARDIVRRALREDRVTAVYQPVVRLSDNFVVGVKASVRLGDAMDVADPSDFASDDADTAVALGRRMLDQALADLVAWNGSRRLPGYLAINANAFELRRADYVTDLLSRTAAVGVPATQLRIGISESAVMGRDTGCTEATLAASQAAGVGLILDGFGTGFGGLALLKRLPFAGLKIAPSFVATVDSDSCDAAIVRAVVDLGRAFKLDTIADGVTTAAQAAALRDLGCGYGQGGFFRAALDAAGIARLPG